MQKRTCRDEDVKETFFSEQEVGIFLLQKEVLHLLS